VIKVHHLTGLGLRSRVGEELFVASVLIHDPVHEWIAVLGRAKARLVDELRVRIGVMRPPHREDVMGVDLHTLGKPSVHLFHNLGLSIGMACIGVKATVNGRVWIGCELDALRLIDDIAAGRTVDRNHCIWPRLNNFAHVAQPRLSREFDLAIEDDSKVESVRRLALGTMIPQVILRVEASLARQGLTTASGHYRQAVAALGAGRWASSNSQVRSMVESLFLELPALLQLTKATSVPSAVDILRKQNLSGFGSRIGPGAFFPRREPGNSHAARRPVTTKTAFSIRGMGSDGRRSSGTGRAR
jgi:hypothetical protein